MTWKSVHRGKKSSSFPSCHHQYAKFGRSSVIDPKEIKSLEDMQAAAKELYDLGAEHVVIKGGLSLEQGAGWWMFTYGRPRF